MKPKSLTITLLAAAQICAANFAGAQTVSTSPVIETSTPPAAWPFGKPNLSAMLARVLLLTDAQKAQLQPYIDAVQAQLEANHQQTRQANDALVKQLYASIRPSLSPDQQTKLDAFEAVRAAALPPLVTRTGSN
jgi:Spy/CpxP family protein refolding chaperone